MISYYYAGDEEAVNSEGEESDSEDRSDDEPKTGNQD